MPKYIVRIEAIVRKDVEVDATNEEEATDLANQLFDTGCDGPEERYEQDTLSVTLKWKPAYEKQRCAYCDGGGVGEYWVTSLSETISAPCHICDGKGVVFTEADLERGEADLSTD